MTLLKKIGSRAFLVWFTVLIISLSILIASNHWLSRDYTYFNNSGDMLSEKAMITKILSDNSKLSESLTESSFSNSVFFEATILSGEQKGQTIKASQNIQLLANNTSMIKEVEPGDKIVLVNNQNNWYFADYYRIDKIIILALVFSSLLLLLGGIKGFNTLLSFGFTFAFIFLVFVPAIMKGHNIYLFTAFTGMFTISSTLVLTNGLGKKTLATITGCVFGLGLAAITSIIMNKFLLLSGFIDDHSIFLSMLNSEKPIDLVAIIFASIIIGALGAIMDIAMDIASALYELNMQVPDIKFKTLLTSGIRIGNDVMGTMANTLILAYIGSSLAGILLLLTYAPSQMILLNRELIVIDLLQALVGSLAILLTIPFTAAACGIIYLKTSQH